MRTDGRRSRAAVNLTILDRLERRKGVEYVVAEQRVCVGKGSQWEGVQLQPFLLALPNEPADGVVGLTERRPFSDEIVGEVRRHHRGVERRSHCRRVELAFRQRA